MRSNLKYSITSSMTQREREGEEVPTKNPFTKRLKPGTWLPPTGHNINDTPETKPCTQCTFHLIVGIHNGILDTWEK